MIRKMSLWLVFLMMFCTAQTLGAAPAAKKRIAVMDFEFGSIQKWWDGTWDIGQGISDLLVDELLKDGTYRLVERKNIGVVLAEQNLTKEQQAETAVASKIGKILGANAIIAGSVTQFGTESRSKGVGGFLSKIPGLGGASVGKQKGKAKVAVTARIVDVNTGEILGSITGQGESAREGWLLGGIGGSSGTIAGGGISISSSDFRETILGEATYAAVKELVSGLASASDKIPTVKIAIRGMVADVSGDKVVLNIGESHGVAVGDTLQVYEVIKSIKDPATGEVLIEETKELGQIRIDEVQEKFSVGTILSGTDIKVGSLIKSLPPISTIP